jgi:nitrate reductase NapE component
LIALFCVFLCARANCQSNEIERLAFMWEAIWLELVVCLVGCFLFVHWE